MIFPKKKKKEKKRGKNPLLLCATAKLGEMALAYSKSLLKKKKACLGSHCDSAQYIYVHSLLQKHRGQHSMNMLVFRKKKNPRRE